MKESNQNRSTPARINPLQTYFFDSLNYALLQAAIAAGCYDSSSALNSDPRMLDAETQHPTPGTSDQLGYRGYLSNVGGNLINFNNFYDYALATRFTSGLESNWERNELDYKPNHFHSGVHENPIYLYDDWPRFYDENVASNQVDAAGNSFTRIVTDAHESMAFVARPRSKAAGAQFATRGRISGHVELNAAPFNFTDSRSDHSAEFNRPIQQLVPFYQRLGQRLGVLPTE